jgi:hypothetical protein
MTTYLENTKHKRGGGVAQGVGPEFKHWYRQKKAKACWELLAHTCNPSYSGGTDQEDHSSQPARANSSQESILKNPSPKKKKSKIFHQIT